MVERTREKLHVTKEGECVAVFVPEFDRGRGDPENIVGVILEIKNEKCIIETKGRVINSWMENYI